MEAPPLSVNMNTVGKGFFWSTVVIVGLVAVVISVSSTEGSAGASGYGRTADCESDEIRSQIVFEDALKSQLRDPDSYRKTSLKSVYDRKIGQFRVAVEYRAKNGFGGYSLGSAGGNVDPSCKVEFEYHSSE
jgi:hypothetical protein